MKDKLTQQDIDDLISEVTYSRPIEGTLTVCVLELSNGSTVTGTSNVINPANFSEEIGRDVALSNAKGKIWELEGYAIKRDISSAVERAAKTAHEVNRAYCAALGDLSQPSWEEAPEWQKSSARMGVEAILKNPEQTPEMSHESWMAQKVSEGWIYGPLKNPEKKEHPCMVPYSMLSKEQRMKDSLFIGAVLSVLN